MVDKGENLMGTSGRQSTVSFRSLMWREWPIILLAVICLIIATPHFVAAEINESAPPTIQAPSDVEADFVVFGDSQGSFGYVWPVAPVFDNMLRLINEIDVPMAFHVGDFYVGESALAMDVEDQAEYFLNDMAELNITWWPVMGNHDAAGKGWEITKDIIFDTADTYYSFETADSHFTVLDGFMPGYEGRISERQMAWLENDLSENNKPHLFVFVHAPLYSLDDHLGSSMDRDIELRDRLANLLVENGVDVVFNGHEHSYASFGYRGLMQVTTGGSGGHLRGLADFDELEDECGYNIEEVTRYKTIKTLHYVCVKTTDEQIEITAYDLEGNIIDQFSVPA